MNARRACSKPPLVYSCSGCSSAAQMANQMALWLDREGLAEMSCIAGVGGGVSGLVQTAQSGRPILALDGCVLACAAACLGQAGVIADGHVLLSDSGVKKRKHADFDQVQAREVYLRAVVPRARALLGDPSMGADIDADTLA
ncbi:MAG: putative zinc-binding protein [Xanthomonadales bacterium]|uniref:putative zinc-binding protein n=2 Tax=Dokdonella sp. TaxID=2291710 RepID=UPI002BB56DFF|nr:putative zinc-binding protein [Xanthomonadales bacterium]HQV73483.1 putative zinc-binding protein [Dokdonella sp.]MBK7013069.1 putative zinc-binding protein [Xanthomonadales bacterium]MBK7208852.1 putative zinc-binding protein [Xanthomonadales bacterium]MBL0221882.1 putative zinc-binding protein [Xanthomonadales bacterium]